ncbi:twinfilin-1 [Metarhizium album ARSEF 1941]|uniref:Twinfilin-1 n=1 Tax=Metarhizium album (strain ARSEF 1941) TaxID=1081103 RepID=A0A0B2WUN5_METAS|nr:twinfilin-1 [Metarhizium album ARSEF 1941]KHN99741.1 twinfilin-1 [Metarhizium album ARSEF 1941]
MLLLALGVAATVLAQADHAIDSFAYQGCSSVDMSCFTPPVLLNDEPTTPEMCQRACQGHQFAALFPADCRCGDDANVIKALDERACNNPCLGDPKHGMCGSICPAEGPGIANVYTKTAAASQQPQVVTIHTTSTLALPITSVSSEDCTTSDQAPVTEQLPGGLITPVGTAPGIPTTFTFVLSTSPATSSGIPPSPTELTTSCSEEQSSAAEEPTVAQPSTTCEEDPASVTASSAVPAPYGASTASPPIYTSDASTPEVPTSAVGPVTSPVASAQSYPDPYTSGSEQDPAATASSIPGQSQDDPNQLSTSTVWSHPSDVADPTGQPPIPAQVPGSDSTHSMVPPLATIGGLAFIAAIIM